MGLLSFLRRVYDLDTLDTRFSTSSTTSYKTVIDARNDPALQNGLNKRISSKAQPSKWNTPEFYIYFLVILICVPLIFWVPYSVSQPSDPRYHKFEHHLSPGWVPGRQIDVSDNQYHTFRTNLPYMALLLIFHPICRKIWNAVNPLPRGKASSDEAEARLNQRASFDRFFAIIFLVALHGFSAFKVLAILYINYNIATGLPKKYVPATTWVFNICTLFANELCNGYKYRDIASLISLSGSGGVNSPEGFLVQWGSWLDSWGGIMPRWEILFNITVLRLISFNFDYYWSLDRRSASPLEVCNWIPLIMATANARKKKQLDPANLSERERVTIPAAARDFTFRNYLAYTVYAPLYLTGPILTFNDYISQLRYRAASIETPRTIHYAVRFVLVLLAMELILHFNYVNAIDMSNPDWSSYTPAQLSLLSYNKLHIIWLKLLLPWRLFRLWALIDGIDPPENMIRCPSDNYSTLAFWRAWHRSYNKWLVRYIWIPLGGASFRNWRSSVRTVVSYLLIFTFVALWHDIKLRLVIWGWLIVFFILPEVIATMMFPARKWETRPTAYRMLCCLGGVGNALMMMSANLVGFAVGLDGLESIAKGIFHDFSGLIFFVTACSALFVGVQVMFEIRESELRRGIALRC